MHVCKPLPFLHFLGRIGFSPCALRILLAAINTSASLHNSFDVWLELAPRVRAVVRREPPEASNTSNMSFRAAKEDPIPFVFLPFRLKNDFLTRAIFADADGDGLTVTMTSVDRLLLGPTLSFGAPSKEADCGCRPKSMPSRTSRANSFRKRFSASLHAS